MAYTRNDGFMSGAAPVPGSSAQVGEAPSVGRVTGFLLIAAAVLTVAMFWLPVMTIGLHGDSWDIYVWKNAGRGWHTSFGEYFSAAPYVLMVISAGVVGTLLAVGAGARRRVLFWAAAFAGGLVLQMASGNVVGYSRQFGDHVSPGSGFWVIILVMLVAIAALASALRDAVVAKRGVAQEPSGGAADRVGAVFLLVAAAVDFWSSFPSLVRRSSDVISIWAGGPDSVSLPAAHFALGLIAVAIVAVALLAGAGVRNAAVRAAAGAAAGLIFTTAISGLCTAFSLEGLNFWEYAGAGFWLKVITLVLSFAATVAGLVAQLARPRLMTPPRVGYGPGFMPPAGAMPGGPGAVNPFAPVGAAPASVGAAPNPFAQASAAPNPFAQGAPAPNPFAPAATVANPAPGATLANPFAPSAPEVEATVKIEPEQVPAAPPRMAKVYDGKDDDGRPVVNRESLEGNTRTAVLAYLESAPIVLAARSFEQDEFVPADRDVPLNFRTDGTWVWAGAVAHYLHKHGLPPEPELVRHITGRGFRVGEVSEAAQDAAIRVITAG
ncbi:hypothetical protein [Nocardia sp. NPDC046763]|uniref:hypothetical protein n=1 Tax=Nocardia sp. NPDC046763 TaxID=3155256 RepID=UPI0033F6533A